MPGAVLGVGIATLDIVNSVAEYPAEDAEVRALDQRTVRGGNCANTLDVLAQLDHRCAWVGVLAGDAGGDFIAADLAARGIQHTHARCLAGGATPTSYIALSLTTGSRTIIHYRDLPELTAADFHCVPLSGWDWVHFEGRHPAETAQMIARVRRERPAVPVSVEIEKPRAGIEALFNGADVLIFSRAYVQALSAPGEPSPRECLHRLAAQTDAALCLLPWGAQGAYGLARDGAVVFAPAHPPAVLRDSLAAGDVFNAAIIDGLMASGVRSVADVGSADLRALLERANRLAGCKCGMKGLDGLAAAARGSGWPGGGGP